MKERNTLRLSHPQMKTFLNVAREDADALGDRITSLEAKAIFIRANFLKRGFDIVVSLLVLVLLVSWLYPLIALCIKLSSRGPVLFRQRRIGINGNIFNCYKFRTMRVMSQNKYTPTEKNDIRVTKVGKFLRKSNLDELPQIINVLIGEMSIIGPRPHPIAFHNEYSKYIENISLRLLVKPGITGLAQIKGYRGDVLNEELNKKRTKMRVSLDLAYIQNWSVGFDVYIMYQTVLQMVHRKTNAH